MIREKNPLLDIKIKKKRVVFIEFYNSFTKSLYSLFDLILKDPIENFWYECFDILLGYFQLIAFIFNSTVNILLTKFYLYSFIQFGNKIILLIFSL